MSECVLYAAMDACYAWDRFRFRSDSPIKEARALVELEGAMARLREEIHQTNREIDEPG